MSEEEYDYLRDEHGSIIAITYRNFDAPIAGEDEKDAGGGQR